MDFFASAHSKLNLQIFAFAACFLFATISIQAQEVTLVTSGEGTTKAEATAAALRSAIEQSFETFVSSNTTILNDDIVKDEVATVTSGNIKSYKELSCTKDQQGVYTVSVSATVSLGKLIEYAKSHGSSAEFAGQTFAMNMKMLALNKKNEKEALDNLLVQLNTFKDNLFDFRIKVNDPEQTFDGVYDVNVCIYVVPNQNYLEFMRILMETLSALSIKESERDLMFRSNIRGSHIGLITQKINERTMQLEDDYFYLRLEKPVISDFAEGVCRILNEAQVAFVVQEKGKPETQKVPKPIRFKTGSWMRWFYVNSEVGITCSKGGILSTLDINKVINEFYIHFIYSLDNIGSVSGFEVLRGPLKTNDTK